MGASHTTAGNIAECVEFMDCCHGLTTGQSIEFLAAQHGLAPSAVYLALGGEQVSSPLSLAEHGYRTPKPTT